MKRALLIIIAGLFLCGASPYKYVNNPMTGKPDMVNDVPVFANGTTLSRFGAGPTYNGQPIGSGGGSATYTNATPVPSTIGGIVSGTTFAAVPLTTVFDSLLYPYQAPTFSAFGFVQISPVEVGTTISGTKTFTWTSTNSSNIVANSIMIQDITGSSTLISGSANDGTHALSIGTVQKLTATSNTWRITGTKTAGGTITRDQIVTWQFKRYFGESASSTLNEAGIEALRMNSLTSTHDATYPFNAGGYKYLSYPVSWGLATTFKDSSTNLDVPFEAAYTIPVTNAQGVTTDYYVHRSTNILGAAISIIVT